MAKTSRTASVSFIFVTILIDALGIGLLIPVLPDVIRRFGTDPQWVNHTYGLFIACYALMQFLASPVLGSLSDRFGRRSILLMSLLGAGLDYLLMAYAPDLAWLFVGRVISGLTAASMTVASSYMADISTDENRAANFGIIGAGWGFGFIFGPALGGLLVNQGFKAPFIAAALLSLVNFAFGLFVLPESLPANLRRPMELKRLNPFASLYKVLRPSPISALIWGFFLLFLAGNSHPSVWTLYTQYKFNWTSTDVGLSLSFVGIVTAISQGYLTRVLIPKIGERRAVLYGTGCNIVCFALFGLATQGWMLYAVLIVGALSGIAPAAIQSLISRGVPSQEQGELQGSLVSIGSLAAIIAPLVYTDAFARFTGPDAIVEFPGFPYIVASLFSVVAMVIYLKALPKQKT